MADKRKPKTRSADVKGRLSGELDSTLLHLAEVQADDTVSLAALREVIREHGDVYLIGTDMEDADERSFPAVVREQS